MRVYVILPAAGLGTRMVAPGAGGGTPKQFMELGGVPVLVHSVRAFRSIGRIAEIVVAARASENQRLIEQLQMYSLDEHVRIVTGGDTRQESVANALAALSASAEDIVLVHDAVRPLIDRETIDRVIGAVEKHGAAIVGIPAVDTIKQVERTADGALITATIPRERVVQAQTPQGFRYAVLQRAFAEAAADQFAGTDEASLAERAGTPVAVVMGSAQNLKITKHDDLALAEFYLAQNERRDKRRAGRTKGTHQK